jgi:DNA helicase-2/ATP-dependent DNA helicase PcrA
MKKNDVEIVNNNSIQPKKYILKKSKQAEENFKISYKTELNKSQYEAVISTEGPVLVIAGAGTGKTRTLVYRVARLVEKGINPENILLLTFTRKSAKEMIKRASVVLDSRCDGVSGGTFHSFANLILRKYSNLLGLKNSFTILDTSDAQDIVDLVRGRFPEIKEKRFPRKSTICDIYSKSINKSSTADEIIATEYPHFINCVDTIKLICKQYCEYKRENSLLDYDDLLIYLKLLLESNEELRNQLSDKYKYILIDEYQDTNSIQADITRLLACKHNNVMAVGDDAQSIYSFRGANFQNIMDFPNIFEGTKIIKLEENYRSTQEILNFSNEIISHAVKKYEKSLFSCGKTGVLPAIICSADQQTEAEFVAQRILELSEEGIPLNEIAILARSARSTYKIEIELNKKGLPFKKFGGYKFVETAHIKDIIAHLRVLMNPEDIISWNRILLLLSGIGSTTSNKLISVLSKGQNTEIEKIRLKATSKEALTKLLEVIDEIMSSKMTIFDTVEKIIAYYQPLLAEKYDDFNKREKDLENFLSLVQGYSALEDFLSDIALEPPENSVVGVEGGAVYDEYLTLSTIHSAKGLEWKAVFITGAVDGKFPSVYSYNAVDDLEEERRLMYVAATRAKNELYVTYPIDMFDHSVGMVLSKPSRFIEDVSDTILERWSLVLE